MLYTNLWLIRLNKDTNKTNLWLEDSVIIHVYDWRFYAGCSYSQANLVEKTFLVHEWNHYTVAIPLKAYCFLIIIFSYALVRSRTARGTSNLLCVRCIQITVYNND